jgi:FkbM family methyltransferase
MISYAQNFEDVMLNRVFGDRTDGFYVDVGAADPVNLSVTKWFYDLGWTGVNIEPHPEFFEKLQAERPRDINLNCGAGAFDGEAVLHEFSTKEWSTFATSRTTDPGGPIPLASRTVQICTLDSVLNEHARGRRVDFLKVDVEGWEKEVLSGIDLRRHRPKVILVEAVDRDTHAINSDWEGILLGSGYKLAYFDGLNKFYLNADESADFEKYFAAPPNVFDDFRLNTHVEQQKQIETLSWMVDRSEKDRAAHIEQIRQLTDMIKASEADRAARLDQIHVLTDQIHNLNNLLTESESDRAARLDGINQLTTMLNATEAERSERLAQIQLLAGKLEDAEAQHVAQNREETLVVRQIEVLKSMLRTLEADRAARLEQVHQLTAWLKDCTAERTAEHQENRKLGGLLEQSEAARRAVEKQYRGIVRLGPIMVGLRPRN